MDYFTTLLYLLIDDVEGEDTETVELLLPGGRPHRVEGAAGDGGEDGALQGNCDQQGVIMCLTTSGLGFSSLAVLS